MESSVVTFSSVKMRLMPAAPRMAWAMRKRSKFGLGSFQLI
ncbi:hypothetical protein PT276_06690 [Orbaceae bacterium ESL0721]|nr:hypothetical protein [Orbaceae bacterium ESL0721]